jgi:hypothetical protein
VSGQARPVEPGEPATLASLFAGGAVQLGNELPPGDYVLQVSGTDALAKEKQRTAVQSIDFEIAP